LKSHDDIADIWWFKNKMTAVR